MHNLSGLKRLLLLFGLLLIILSSIGYFYYNRWQQNVNRANTLPYILESSVFVCELESVGKQWSNFCETSIGQDISMLPFFTSIQPTVESLTQAGLSKNLLDELSLIVSVHGLSEQDLGYVFYLDSRRPATKSLIDFLDNQRKNNKYKVETRNYAGYTIATISQLKTKLASSLYMLKHNNYVMLSFSELLIEDIVRGLAYKNSPGFLPVQKTFYKQGGLYVNFSKLPTLLRIFFKQEYSCKLGTSLSAALPAAQLEVKLTNHYLLLNGITNKLPASSDKIYWVDRLTKQEASPLRLLSYIPATSGLVKYYTFKDTEKLGDAIKAYRDKQPDSQGPIFKRQQNIKELLDPLLKNDMALCTLGSNFVEEVLFIRVNNLERAIELLEEAKLIKNLSEQQLPGWPTVYSVDNEVFKSWLPSMVFSDFQPKFLSILDNCLVLVNTFSVLKHLQEAYRKGNTWTNQDIRQQKFLSSTLEAANFSMFVNLEYGWGLFTQKLKPVWKALFDKHLTNLKKYGYASVQLVNTLQNDQPGHYINILLAHIADGNITKKTETDTLSALNLFQAEAPIITKAFFVETHKKDIPHLLVQDALHQLYFMDITGKLVWKKKLDGPIVTDIFPIDIYKNNKWQYICTTSDLLHIIDYTGQEVSPYPKKLPQPGKGIGLNLIDYNQDKNYRILLTDSKGDIYLRDTQYRPLPGWNPKSLHAPFAITPFHIRTHKDYFISLQTNGTVYALNRRGQVYNGFPIKLQDGLYNHLIVQKGNQPSTTRLVVLTEEGKLNVYDLLGSLRTSIQLEKTDYTAKFILCPEMGSGNNYVIIRQDLDKVAVLDEEGKVIFEKVQEAEKTLLYQYHVFGNYKFYVVTDPSKKKAYIYDVLGKLVNRVPLNSNGQPVSLFFKDATQQLIVYTTFNKSILKYSLTVEVLTNQTEQQINNPLLVDVN